jgi:ribonuclease HI
MATNDALKPLIQVEIFSDGGAEPNPGKGGFGLIMCAMGKCKEFSQGYRLTTNNRMELMGVITGLERLKEKCSVTVFTDSQYVVNGIEKGWARAWKAKEWKRKNDPVLNADLWARLLEAIAQHEVVFKWIRGHNGHPENERCDRLADAALNGANLIEDEGYLASTRSKGNTENNFSTTTKGPKTKVLIEGDPCRNCGAPVLKRVPKNKIIKPHQTYYFEYTLICPGCKNIYNVEEARREVIRSGVSNTGYLGSIF